jgi:hypothetical protein
MLWAGFVDPAGTEAVGGVVGWVTLEDAGDVAAQDAGDAVHGEPGSSDQRRQERTSSFVGAQDPTLDEVVGSHELQQCRRRAAHRRSTARSCSPDRGAAATPGVCPDSAKLTISGTVESLVKSLLVGGTGGIRTVCTATFVPVRARWCPFHVVI